MFKGFSIEKYKKMKPPSDNSFTTMQEIKEVNAIPMNKSSVKKYDEIETVFMDILKKNNAFKDKSIEKNTITVLGSLIEKSYPIVKKLKDYFNRPRPKVIAKKMNIKIKDYELPSMNTASYPSGHSVQGTLIAKVLSDKWPMLKGELIRAGKKISDSRRVAKAHYKSDSKLGELMGNDMYKYLKSKNKTLT
jgi:hypothetical protein